MKCSQQKKNSQRKFKLLTAKCKYPQQTKTLTAKRKVHNKKKSPQQKRIMTLNIRTRQARLPGSSYLGQLGSGWRAFSYGGPVLMYCFNCGSVVSENSNFCASCGQGKCFLRVIAASSRSFLFLSMFQCD